MLLCDNYRVLHGRDIFEGDRLHAVSWFGDESDDMEARIAAAAAAAAAASALAAATPAEYCVFLVRVESLPGWRRAVVKFCSGPDPGNDPDPPMLPFHYSRSIQSLPFGTSAGLRRTGSGAQVASKPGDMLNTFINKFVVGD